MSFQSLSQQILDDNSSFRRQIDELKDDLARAHRNAEFQEATIVLQGQYISKLKKALSEHHGGLSQEFKDWIDHHHMDLNHFPLDKNTVHCDST